MISKPKFRHCMVFLFDSGLWLRITKRFWLVKYCKTTGCWPPNLEMFSVSRSRTLFFWFGVPADFILIIPPFSPAGGSITTISCMVNETLHALALCCNVVEWWFSLLEAIVLFNCQNTTLRWGKGGSTLKSNCDPCYIAYDCRFEQLWLKHANIVTQLC